MDSEKAEGTVRPIAEAVRVTRMPGARLVTTKVTAERTGGAYFLFEVEVAPWGGEGPHVQHREDECLYVVEGRFAFVVEGAKRETGPGAYLYVPKGALHAYENVGETTGRLLTLHTPGGSHELFLEEAGEPVDGGGAPRPRRSGPMRPGSPRSRPSTASNCATRTSSLKPNGATQEGGFEMLREKLLRYGADLVINPGTHGRI